MQAWTQGPLLSVWCLHCEAQLSKLPLSCRQTDSGLNELLSLIKAHSHSLKSDNHLPPLDVQTWFMAGSKFLRISGKRR